MKLLTNNKIPPHHDSEDHQLKTLFRMAHDVSQNDANTLLDYAQTLEMSHRKDYARLVARGYDFLTFIIGTRASRHFDNFMTDSRRIVQVQHSLWGLLSRPYRLMWRIMLHIASDTALPLAEPHESDEEYGQRVHQTITNPPPHAHHSSVVLDLLVEAADEAFNEHLADHVHNVGTDNPPYRQAFEEYTTHLCDRLNDLVEEYKLENPTDWTDLDEHVADDAFAKLHVLLNQQTALQPHLTPSLDGPMPLLSSVAASMIIDDWWPLRHSLYTVSNLPTCPRTEQ